MRDLRPHLNRAPVLQNTESYDTKSARAHSDRLNMRPQLERRRRIDMLRVRHLPPGRNKTSRSHDASNESRGPKGKDAPSISQELHSHSRLSRKASRTIHRVERIFPVR